MSRTQWTLLTTLIGSLFLLAACAPGSASSSSKKPLKNCFRTAHGIECVAASAPATGPQDVDHDGVSDPLACTDTDSDSGASDGDDHASNADDEGEADDGDSESGADSEAGGSCQADDGASDDDDSAADSDGDADGDSDADGEADSDGDDDGVPDTNDCDCGGEPIPPTDPTPPDPTPPTDPPMVP